MAQQRAIALTVNGQRYAATVEVRQSLVDFLRDTCDLTGTHVGCEHGVCGACTVLMDGASVRSCLVLAAQADGAEVLTVEGLAELGPLPPHPPSPIGGRGASGAGCASASPPFPSTGGRGAGGDRGLHPLQQAFWEHHGLQCGYCTPGILIAALELLRDEPDPDEATIREALSGNLCICTGYVNVVRAVQAAAVAMRGTPEPGARS
ncbi:MAG TPA: (2Fe-2S)-binding protein [Chloroflexota bacterium]|nr:(2Fe-2S)-binding protein [Chloroflexota bacterium]